MPLNIKDYLSLTKPKIMLLVLVSGIAALFMEKSMLHQPLRMLLAIGALYLTGGSANAFNNFFERRIDEKMTRTRVKRPLPLKKISPTQALIFAFVTGIIGVCILGFFFNWLSALLSLGTILFYSLFYTLILKPTTPHNIVIGGAAGAMAPVGMWAAASGSLAVAPWLIFLIVFFWTPPHFWSLAINLKEDYKLAGLPMMPVVKGDQATLKQIFVFTIILFIISLLPVFTTLGLFYLVIAVIFGFIFIFKAFKSMKYQSSKRIWDLFGFSVIYLFVILFSIIIDSLIPFNIKL